MGRKEHEEIDDLAKSYHNVVYPGLQLSTTMFQEVIKTIKISYIETINNRGTFNIMNY